VAQSLAVVLVHLVFSTKERRPDIRPEVEAELHRYLAGTCRELGCPTLGINGTEDHVHIVFSLSRTITIADFVEKVKANSSGWIKTKGREYRDFAWQGGYGAFSIGQSGVPAAKRYLAGQKEHHRKVSFQEELRDLLGRYQKEYDERYLWD